jgi:glycosyltransferase involved in cell wall biosynthesis
MRIALISETWLPSVDGVVTRLRHTVAQLLEAGHRVLVVAPTAGPPMPGLIQYRSRAVVVPFIDPARPWAVPDRRGIARALEAFHPSVVHVVNPVLMGSGAVHYAAGRYPVVASYHTDISAYAARYRLSWTRPLLRRLTRNAYRRADVRLATSPTGQARLTELGICNAAIWPSTSPASGRTKLDRRVRPSRTGSRPFASAASRARRTARCSPRCWRRRPQTRGRSFG